MKFEVPVLISPIDKVCVVESNAVLQGRIFRHLHQQAEIRQPLPISGWTKAALNYFVVSRL
jgi:hypothetical protein